MLIKWNFSNIYLLCLTVHYINVEIFFLLILVLIVYYVINFPATSGCCWLGKKEGLPAYKGSVATFLICLLFRSGLTWGVMTKSELINLKVKTQQ